MKVLAVMGSPLKTGKSFHLTQRVEKSMKELADVVLTRYQLWPKVGWLDAVGDGI